MLSDAIILAVAGGGSSGFGGGGGGGGGGFSGGGSGSGDGDPRVLLLVLVVVAVLFVVGLIKGLRAKRRREARVLLHPGDPSRQTRLVVRGPRIEAIRIAALDAAATPAAITVELRVTGRRYVEDRDTAEVVSGSRDAERAFTEHWTLVLDGTGAWPWRVAATGVPAH